MEDELYDEFGNFVGNTNNEGEGDAQMDQEWMNEMNQLQLDGDSDDDDPEVHEEEYQEALMEHQGKDIFDSSKI